MVWRLFQRSANKSNRTCDWFLPFVARRRLEQQLPPLPRVAALLLQHARLHRQRLRLPCREDSVISSTLAGSAAEPASIFHLLWGEPAAFAADEDLPSTLTCSTAEPASNFHFVQGSDSIEDRFAQQNMQAGLFAEARLKTVVWIVRLHDRRILVPSFFES